MLFRMISGKKIIIIVSVVLLILCATVFTAAWILTKKTFYMGVRIENIDVSGMDKAKAKEIIEEELNKTFLANNVKLRYGEKEWSLDLREISYSFLTEKAIEKAYKVGREGNFLQRLSAVYRARKDNINVDVKPEFDREKLKTALAHIKSEIDQKEVDASAIFKNGNIKFNKEVIGKNIDVDKNLEMIENIILGRNFFPIDLKVDNIYPRVLYEDISVISKINSSFSTSFNPQKTNRSFNIKLACEKINNMILLPGDVFSMDKALGSRSISNGYKNAPVIISGKLIEGVGGGVCQVTTTLYVAVLKSKLEVKERMPHSMPLSYVQPGQDATIAEGYIDFKFKNNNEYPVLISAQASGNTILIRIVGKNEDIKQNVRLKSVVVEEISPGKEIIVVDASVPDGDMVVDKKSVRGLKVVVYRETYDEKSKLIEREKISEDTYKAAKGVIRVSPNYYKQITLVGENTGSEFRD